MLKEFFEEEEYKRLCQSDNLIYKSLEIMTKVFENKCDKGGIPYSVHLLKVYSGVSNYIEKCCALLHDVIEDTNVTYDDLKEVGFNEEIIEILTILTKNKGEDYSKYIDRIISSRNIHALNIKLVDLAHNMEVGRIKNPTVNDYERINKRYLPARERILNELEKRRK